MGVHILVQFQLCDADRDDIINETQSKSILDTIVQTQRQVLSEVFLLHVRVSDPQIHV